MQVHIRLLGAFGIDLDGEPVTAADLRRRDAAALVKRLALAPGRHLHREQLIDALWPEVAPEAVGNRLHKAAHFVRKATGTPRAVVFRGETAALFPDADVTIDAETFEHAAVEAIAAADPDRATDALALWAGPLLALDPYEEWAFGPRERLAHRHRALLRLAERHAELVAIDATDEAAHVAIMRAQLDAGDRAGVRRQFDDLARALEDELGIGPSAEAIALRDEADDGARVATPSAPRFTSLATQTVHRCTTPDGVRLAYATSGSGPPIVKVANWLTHIDYDWTDPVWGPLWHALSRDHTLVRYDERGCGLSDWDVEAAAFTLEAWVRDLETVVDALGLERFPLLGISQGGPIAVTYAARHPERVSHLVVYGTSARATWERASPDRKRELAALAELISVSWGSDEPGFRQVYDAKFLPDGPIEAWRAFDELQRRSTSPRNARRMWKAFGDLDCAEAAGSLDVPTLVLHSRGDLVWDFEEAEDLHARIRGSRLVALDSRNHVLQSSEPAFAHFLTEVGSFLAS